MNSDFHKKFPPNRLIQEKSPYLLQHAHNPVDWNPWGEAAFIRAEAESKPIFLSIGYSTCHWCHVMEKESFEDPEIAAVINRLFIPVKVDREERPDIDNTYMNVCQMATGSGGWPLNIFLTPDKKPIYTTTYIPKSGKHGRLGIIDLLEKIAEVWASDRDKIDASATEMVKALQKAENIQMIEMALNDEPLTNALQIFKNSYDPKSGGFGQAPKFPMSHNFLLLFRLWDRFNDEGAKNMALETLRAIRNGGIYDQLGGGLHRYSVDHKWLVPHFEKMLYDQALLAMAATEAFQITREGFFADMVEDILSYVLNNLTHPQGGFFCGEDADSEGREGTYYLWGKKDIRKILGHDAGELFCRAYGVTAEGNFEGTNILHQTGNLDFIARALGMPPEKLTLELKSSRETLLKVRNRREHPFLDDKILSGWNGLFLAALCRAGSALDNPALIQAAQRGAAFILEELYNEKSGRLLRRWRDGEAAIPGFLEDYAFFAWGLIELYISTFEERYLQLAHKLTEAMEHLFSDGKKGFYDTAADAETVLTRGKNLQDTAIPSGASVAVLNLLRLGRLTGNEKMAERGENYLTSLYSEYFHQPLGYSFLLISLDWILGPNHELLIASDNEETPSDNLSKAFFRYFMPRTVIHGYSQANQGLKDIIPNVQAKTPINGLPTAYICSEQGCRPPTTKAEEMLRLLKQS